VSPVSDEDLSGCLHTLPASASFTGKGFLGYGFGPFRNRNVEILYVESEKGHDTFFISREMTRFYYILTGSGSFTMNGRRYPVDSGMLIEVPPKVEYTYSGQMSMIAMGTPRWRRGNERTTRWNPDVAGHDMSVDTAARPWVTRILRARIAGKSPVGAFMRLNQAMWNALPPSLTAWGPIRGYGSWLHSVARIQIGRAQALSTYFLRNRAELELIGSLLKSRRHGDGVRVAVLGCSTGAEAYSVAWAIRSARPDLKLVMHAVDVSKQAVEFARQGVYSSGRSQLVDTPILSAMTESEVSQIFEQGQDSLRVNDRLREGIEWSVGDAGDPALVASLGLHEIVLANNFLCHMDDAEAERCLRLIAQLVRPGGYLFVSGVALPVRGKVARDLGWRPLPEQLVEIHENDRRFGARWPCHYAAIEPMNRKRKDWQVRYAAAWQMPGAELPASGENADTDQLRMVGADSSR